MRPALGRVLSRYIRGGAAAGLRRPFVFFWTKICEGAVEHEGTADLREFSDEG